MFTGAIRRSGKKLIDVARWFVGDLATTSQTVADDLAHFGAPVEPPKAQTDLTVLPDNWVAATALTTAGSQWQFCKDGVEVALDYARADIAWRYAGLTLTPADFTKLQLLERTVVGLLRRPDEIKTETGAALTLRR
ncbi:hypothetical protein [Pseudoalteromonas rubra]|uniref:hypothetical protein n=1 Tax=Pseudoalteromonas rubra TaxID=43658 RepID=UPI002DB64B90|nr:hypothetical protein [Pseudoalteromonas rubra]MEC4091856.1 hypothetical protein [Pseudoalteromonas rubra]